MRLLAAVTLALVLPTAAVAAQPAAAGPHPAAPVETSQFAFLIGAWDCSTRSMKPDGSGFFEGPGAVGGLLGSGGWAIQDDWESTGSVLWGFRS